MDFCSHNSQPKNQHTDFILTLQFTPCYTQVTEGREAGGRRGEGNVKVLKVDTAPRIGEVENVVDIYFV